MGQQTRPFFVTAKLSCRWDALQTARSQCNEEDLLRAVLGDDHDAPTRRPWLRVDVARGALLLEGVEVSAWQAINLPRIWDDPERDEDPPPDHELERMFARVRGALYAWMEALDHLRPTPPRS